MKCIMQFVHAPVTFCFLGLALTISNTACYIYGFCMILSANIEYFLEQH
jgi:hypothetical protein